MAKALSRRTFLAATGLAWPMARTLAAAAEPSSLRPCKASAWQKHGPVLEASPAAGNIQNFTSPAEPLADDRWRLWYSVSGTGTPFNVAWAEGAPGKAMTHQVAELSEGEPADAPFAIGNLPRELAPSAGGPSATGQRQASDLLLGPRAEGGSLSGGRE